MELFFSQFHLLRPAWLLALIPAIILFSFLLVNAIFLFCGTPATPK